MKELKLGRFESLRTKTQHQGTRCQVRSPVPKSTKKISEGLKSKDMFTSFIQSFVGQSSSPGRSPGRGLHMHDNSTDWQSHNRPESNQGILHSQTPFKKIKSPIASFYDKSPMKTPKVRSITPSNNFTNYSATSALRQGASNGPYHQNKGRLQLSSNCKGNKILFQKMDSSGRQQWNSPKRTKAYNTEPVEDPQAIINQQRDHHPVIGT